MGNNINSLMDMLELTDALNIAECHGKKVSQHSRDGDNLKKKKKTKKECFWPKQLFKRLSSNNLSNQPCS